MKRSNLRDIREKCPGPVPKYTREYLDELADKMVIDVAADEEMLYVRKWLTKNRIVMCNMYDWIDVSKKFKEAYRMAQQICADRVQDGALNGTLNSNIVTKFHPFYDIDVSSALRKYKKRVVEDQLDSAKEAANGSEAINIILKIDDGR